jgi:hypothetical protein
MVDDTPYHNVHGDELSFRLPKRKWRELVFVGAMKRAGEASKSGTDVYVRDPTRPLPPFRRPELFAEDVSFRVEEEGDWIRLTRMD